MENKYIAIVDTLELANKLLTFFKGREVFDMDHVKLLHHGTYDIVINTNYWMSNFTEVQRAYIEGTIVGFIQRDSLDRQ